jgi:glucose/arabinose dehydrogenase
VRVAVAVVLVLAVVATAAASPARRPLSLTQPTSLELEPSGNLLIVENNPGRILRFEPRTGRLSVLADGLDSPYAIVRLPGGSILYSAGNAIRRLGGGVVARANAQVGPIAVSADGGLYYATATGLFRAGHGRLATGRLSLPHGLAVARDGAVLVSDTGSNRVLRVRGSARATSFAAVEAPRGLDVASDGSVYVIDSVARRVIHLSASGKRLGDVGPRLPGDPYDLQAAPGRSVLVLEAGAVGDIRRVAPNGSSQTLTRR